MKDSLSGNKPEEIQLGVEPFLDLLVEIMKWLDPSFFFLAGLAYLVFELVVLGANKFNTNKFTPLAEVLRSHVTDKFCWLFWFMAISSMAAFSLLYILIEVFLGVVILLTLVLSILVYMFIEGFIGHWYIFAPFVVFLLGLFAYLKYVPSGYAAKKVGKVCGSVKATKLFNPIQKMVEGFSELYKVHKDKYCPVVKSGSKED